MKLICLLVIYLSAATPNSKFLGDYAQLDDDEPSLVEAPHMERDHEERTGHHKERTGHHPERTTKSRVAKSPHSPRTQITPSAALLAAAELTPARGSAIPAMHPAMVSKEPMGQAMVQNLTTLLMKQRTGKRVDPDAFDDVITSVRGQMTTQLTDHVNTVGADLQTASAAITECNTNFGFTNANVGSGYNSGETAFNAAIGEHDSAVTTETTECAAKVTKCGQRDNDGAALYNTVRGGAQCAVPATPPAGTTYDETFVFGGVKTWTATINSMHGAWATSKDQCNTAITACSTAETTTAEKETARVEACSTLEAAAVAGTNAYDDCYNAAKGEFDGRMDFEEGLATQKELVNQVELLICYIKVAMKTINDPDVPARTDGSVACGDAGPTEYQCTCTSDDGEEFQQTYSLAVVIPTEPEKDAGWDDKNCAETPVPGILVNFAFGTCGAVLAFGPTQSQCDSAYGADVVEVLKSGYQVYTVPGSGVYEALASGAGGGHHGGGNGGYGMRDVRNFIAVAEGDRLVVVVGQSGWSNPGSGDYGGGGGGGTFVAKIVDSDYSDYVEHIEGIGFVQVQVVAGGGSGMTDRRNSGQAPSGRSDSGDLNSAALGNSNGGGGGVIANGVHSVHGGKSFLNGALGGISGSATDKCGGFGGGGGPYDGGGGGGGYDGGDCNFNNEDNNECYGGASMPSNSGHAGNSGDGSVSLSPLR